MSDYTEPDPSEPEAVPSEAQTAAPTRLDRVKAFAREHKEALLAGAALTAAVGVGVVAALANRDGVPQIDPTKVRPALPAAPAQRMTSDIAEAATETARRASPRAHFVSGYDKTLPNGQRIHVDGYPRGGRGPA